MKHSAGTLLYRQARQELEVLLVHPSGNYNRHAPWSIPKGLPDSEDEEFEQAARRETLEETGVQAGQLVSLGTMTYKKSRKTIHCFAGPVADTAEAQPASWEVDQAEFVAIEKARELIHPDQAVFLDRLLEHVKQSDQE